MSLVKIMKLSCCNLYTNTAIELLLLCLKFKFGNIDNEPF